MYLHTSLALGQAELPSAYGTACLQDDVKQRVEAALLSDNVSKNLDQFVFKSPKLLDWHRTWIKRQFVPAIVKSFLTDKPIKTIILVGDADEIGTPARNYKLGKERAEAVREELKTQLKLASPGVAAKVTIEVFSRGECWPVVKSGKKEARNRRVEVFGVRATAPATKTQPAPDPGQTPSRRKFRTFGRFPTRRKRKSRKRTARRSNSDATIRSRRFPRASRCAIGSTRSFRGYRKYCAMPSSTPSSAERARGWARCSTRQA